MPALICRHIENPLLHCIHGSHNKLWIACNWLQLLDLSVARDDGCEPNLPLHAVLACEWRIGWLHVVNHTKGSHRRGRVQIIMVSQPRQPSKEFERRACKSNRADDPAGAVRVNAPNLIDFVGKLA